MNPSDDRQYVLGTHDEELVRLGFQHRAWARYAYRLWETAGFAPGQTILDLGCGPGYCTVDLAHLVGPAGRVIAVDESARFIDHLNKQCQTQGLTQVDSMVGDVQRLELPQQAIDAAFARWVLCFVPDPEAVVARVARALRPGGVLAVQDYFNYRAISMAPSGPALARVADAVDRSFRLPGGDPDVAGRLPGIMTRCGLEVTLIRPILRVARPGSALWQWPTTFFKNYLPKLVELKLLTPQQRRDFEEEWADRTNDPSAFFCTPPVFDILATRQGA